VVLLWVALLRVGLYSVVRLPNQQVVKGHQVDPLVGQLTTLTEVQPDLLLVMKEKLVEQMVALRPVLMTAQLVALRVVLMTAQLVVRATVLWMVVLVLVCRYYCPRRTDYHRPCIAQEPESSMNPILWA